MCSFGTEIGPPRAAGKDASEAVSGVAALLDRHDSSSGATGAANAVVAGLAGAANPAGIRLRVSAALRALAAHDPQTARELVSLGAADVAVILCSSTSDGVRRNAVAILAHLTGAKEQEQALIDAKAVPALLATGLLRTHDPVTQSRCV